MTGSDAIAKEDDSTDPLHKTPLEALHQRLGAKMVPFAGYDMPIHYPTGIVFEHKHVRQSAGLFDVSHMGVLEIRGDQACQLLEQLIPCDLAEMSIGQMRYGIFMLETGGILDDLLITRREDGYLLVVNASRKQKDLSYLTAHLHGKVPLCIWEEPIMIALQGPKAASVLERHFPTVINLPFMTAKAFGSAWVSRSGYTGEDGYEIIFTGKEGISFTEQLLEAPEVMPIGLGARDSLRLEAGLCLYGHELDEQTTPIEAGIAWSIGKRRRQEGGFLGFEKVLKQLDQGCSKRRVGLTLSPGSIPREGSEIYSLDGALLGVVSSGGHSPTLGYPIAMGYVDSRFVLPGTEVCILIRGQMREAKVIKMPFVSHSYFKG